ncbi:MAG: amino acid adenylation domain-containing protein, partial [Gammaproteobacteria bacterium]|nr:amino acid adenylation domain-containing protein [Gammaproteobacteria bacterium]
MNKPITDALATNFSANSPTTKDVKKEETQALLSRLKQAGIRIALGDNDKLKIRAPKGALTDEFKRDLKQFKDDIIALLKAQESNRNSNSSDTHDKSFVSNSSNAFPLSFTQERLWFLDQLEGASNLYNMPGLFKLTGKIHLDKLTFAFKQIIQRHDVLRTHFLTKKGKGFAHILPESNWQLEQYDLSEYSQQETHNKSELIIREQLASSFELTKDCLLRTLLIKQSENTSILMLNMHHIISDGWSVQVLVREFISLYTSLVEEKSVQLDELPIQYTDYAHWQRNHLKGEVLEKSLDYWRKQLKDVQILELPTDFQRPAIQSSHGALHTFSLEPQLIQQLKETAQQQGVTLFMTLLAGLSILLSRYSNQDDICIGSPIANRNRKELQNLIGFFANTLVFRQKIVPGQTINEFLQIIKKNTIDAYEYQETPFEKVVDGLNVERSLGHSPLFQVMLVLQNIAQERIELPEMNIESLSFDSGSAKFDLTFTVEEAQSTDKDEPVAVSIEYNTDLFKQETIEILSSHFTRVLEVISVSSNQEVMQVEFLSVDERKKQLTDWQREPVKHSEFFSVQHMFETQVEKTPNATALIFGEQKLTYQELNHSANQLAHLLQSKGIGQGDSVGICLNRSVEMVVSLYGVLKSGASYIPMDVNYPKERLLYMLSETGSPLLITNQTMQEKLDVDSDKVFLVNSQWLSLKQFNGHNTETIDQRDDLLYTIFTSGSTGKPKGARVRHSGELNLLPWYTNDFEMTEQDNILLMSAFGFDLTQKNLFAPLICGGTLVIPEIEHYDHKYLIQTIKEKNISWLNCAPSAFYPIVENKELWSDISTLRYVFLGGEPINLQKVAQWEQQSQCKLVNSYGPTECTDIASFHILDSHKPDNKSIPIGLANHNVLLYILNEQKQLIPEGHIGELFIGGQGVGLGYINQSELTQEKFTNNPFLDDGSLIYQTGDLVRYQSEGVIEYIGRTDFQVKLRGLRIELGEIEYHLGNLDGIVDGVVRIVKDNNNIEQLVAYIVRDTKSILNKEAYREALIDNLPEYMIPNHYIDMDVIPLTPNGKVDNKALPELEIKSSKETYQAPETHEEKILSQIWSDILRVEKIGIFDNFFEMGGDSILSIQIISQANEKGLVLQARDIFEHQNIVRLAQHAQNNAKKQIETLISEQGILTGDIILSPVQTRFLKQNFKNKDHWNQSILLSVSKQLTEELLNKALNILVTQHDVLHSKFSKNEQGEWSQTYIDLKDNTPLVALEKITSDYESELDGISNNYQSSLSIEEGRLLQAVLFEKNSNDINSEENNRLLIIIHHLVVDGISWRVLFSDLQQICQSILTKKTQFSLPNKKSSYRQWTEMLTQYAQSSELLKELPFWQAQAKKEINALPVDHEADTILMKDSVFLNLELSEEQTQQLLFKVNDTYNTEINDILLAGLLLAINNWCGHKQITIALEGHGRETLSESIDISNTAGWFTSVFPIFLDMDNAKTSSTLSCDLSTLLKSIKEQLKQTPNKGVGYSILRYLSPNKEISQSITIEPEISFNYLGQSDNTFSESEFFNIANEASGQMISPDNHHPYLLDLNCVVVNGCLRLDWTFSGKHFNKENVETLAQAYNEALLQIISHCMQSGNSAYTPSDFPLTQINDETRLTQPALDSLCDLAIESFASKKTALESGVNFNSKDIVEDIYPLSPMQKGMLFHSTFHSEEEMYIEQLQLNFTGELNVEVFEEAWQSVIAKHSILRTLFVYEQGLEALQIVQKNVNCKIQVVDFNGWDEFHLQDFLKADRVRGFKLDEAPLMRLHLLKLEEKNLLVWTFHHLLADGWSTALILQEVLHSYQTLMQGKSKDKTKDKTIRHELADDYKEFISYLLRQDKQAEEDYWKRYLKVSEGQSPSATELPLTMAHFDASNMGEIKKFKIDFTSEKTKGLIDFSKKYHLTINTLIQGIWGLLLGKYSHTNDVQFGVVVSGRPTDISGIEKKVGLFINSLPMKIIIDKKQSTHEWFKSLQKEQVEHQLFHHSAINDIQHWSQVQASDLFNHVFVFENYPVSDALSGNDLPLNVLDLEMVEKTNFPLTVSVTLSDCLAIEFGYDSKVYNEFSIQTIASQLEFIIDSVLQTPEVPVSELKWLSESDEQNLLVELNKTEQSYKQYECLQTTFEKQAELFPEKIAVRDSKSVQLSYKQLNEKANQLAYYLLAQGIESETIIGVCMDRTSDMLVSLLAVLKVGCAYVPMDPNYPEERLSFILEDSNIPILLTQTDLLEQLPASAPQNSMQKIAVDQRGLLESFSIANLGTLFSSEQLAYIIYTSGSTGKPKGVMVRHRNVQNLCQWHQSTFVVNEDSRATQIANIAFDAAAWEIWPYLLAGASLYLVDQQTVLSGNNLLDYYAQNQITHSFVPTPVAESILQLEWNESIALEYLLTGGDRLSGFDAEKYGFEFVNNYGPTEATVVATSISLTSSSSRKNSLPPIGRPVSNTQLYVVDEDIKLVPMGVVGELLIGGSGVAKGY